MFMGKIKYDLLKNEKNTKARLGILHTNYGDCETPMFMPVGTLANVKTLVYRLGLKENKCEICGISEWQGKPIQCELHHINGDPTDNRIENLQIFANTTTLQNLEMIPLAEFPAAWDQTVVYQTPPQNL